MEASVAPGQQPDPIERAILAWRSAYETHAQDSGFGIRFGERTCFDHNAGDLVIGVGDLKENGLSEIGEFDFCVLHEIKHYLDLKSGPEAYQRLIAKGTRPDGLGQLYFSLYNCTEDISVNVRNAHDSALYRGQDQDQVDATAQFSPMIRSMYNEKLFKERDFSRVDPKSGLPAVPLCQQYAYYILNLGMGVADDITLTPKVREVIDEPINIYGKKYELAEFIQTFLRPAPPTEKSEMGNDISKRIEMVEKYLEPRFEKLLEIDKKIYGQAELIKMGEGQEFGAPKGSSIEDFERALKRVVEEKREKAKSPADRANDLERQQQEDAARNAGLNEQEIKDFVSRLNRLEPVISKLAQLWLSVPQISTETSQRYEGYYNTGVRPDMHRIIAQFVNLDQGDIEVPIMERIVEDQTQASSPKKVRVRLPVDASGSMEGYMSTVADLAVALSASFIRANAEASIREMDFGCESQCIIFGVGAIELIKCTPKITLTEIMAAYSSFFKYQDETNDHTALDLIKRGLDPAEEELRSSGELLDLVLEITDGKTKQPNKTRSLIADLEKCGLMMCAIGIGDIPLFEEIWNSGQTNRGARVQNADELYLAVYSLLQAVLNSKI